MSKIEKKINKLTKISIDWCKNTENKFISYRKQRIAWRKFIKTEKFTKEELLKMPIIELL